MGPTWRPYRETTIMEILGSIFKYIVFSLNVLFFISGVAVIALGIYYQTTLDEYVGFVEASVPKPSVVLISFGSIILLVSFFGCCGACTENPFMMRLYSVLMLLIILVEVGGVVTAFIMRDEAQSFFNNGMVSGLKNYGKSDKQKVTELWDHLQNKMKCCAVNAYTDWNATLMTDSTPDSCCKVSAKGCGKGVFSKTFEGDSLPVYAKGCIQVLEETIAEHGVKVAAVALTAILIQICLVVVGCLVAKRLKKEGWYA